MLHLLPGGALLAIATSCARPADAPATLDELCGYLFAHFQDEDPAGVVEGMTNLQLWLEDNIEETAEGYVIVNLAQDAVDALDDNDRDLEGLVGAAIGFEHEATIGQLAQTSILVDPMELYPDEYDSYVRTYETDTECFFDRSCDQLQVHNSIVANYPLGLTVASEVTGQYRWFELDSGLAYLQRTWLDEPAEVSLDWLGVPEQYFMVVNMPLGDHSVRVVATWIVAEIGDSSVPENMALDMVIDSLIGSEEQLASYIAANDVDAGELDASEPSGTCSSAPVAGAWLLGLLALGRRRA